jgi:hypothetical protein
MDKHHGHGHGPLTGHGMDMQNGMDKCSICSLDMDTQHGHGHAA